MSKEKQIEEMAKYCCNACEMGCGFEGECCLNNDYKACTISIETATAIYEAGYRKQSEVVRCKDCKHFYQDGNLKVCRHWNCHSTEDDAYCSYAKMKGGE